MYRASLPVSRQVFLRPDFMDLIRYIIVMSRYVRTRNADMSWRAEQRNRTLSSNERNPACILAGSRRRQRSVPALPTRPLALTRCKQRTRQQIVAFHNLPAMDSRLLSTASATDSQSCSQALADFVWGNTKPIAVQDEACGGNFKPYGEHKNARLLRPRRGACNPVPSREILQETEAAS